METINCKWSVNSMERDSTNGFVVIVFWSCHAEGGGKSSFYGDQTKFTLSPSNKNFIPYENLTEEIVLNWVFVELGNKKETIEKDRIAKVKKQLQATTALGVPWSNMPATIKT